MQCENELESIFSFHENIFNVGFDLESLEKRLETHLKLLVYAETDGFCALSFLEDNGNVAVEEAMAVDNRFGKYGIASALLREAEKQAAIKLGSHLIARNSIEEAEGFQQKCGYTGNFESRCKSTQFTSCQRLIPDIRWLSRTYMMKKPISFA